MHPLITQTSCNNAQSSSLLLFKWRIRDSTPYRVGRSVRQISEFRAFFAVLLLPNCPRLDCRVSGLVFVQVVLANRNSFPRCPSMNQIGQRGTNGQSAISLSHIILKAKSTCGVVCSGSSTMTANLHSYQQMSFTC